MNFMDGLQNEMNNTLQHTENCALGYKTTGKKLLDLNFGLSSMRNMSESQIVSKFVDAFYENKMVAMKWLFYARDAREGCGERRTFRTIVKYLAANHPQIAKAIVPLVSEYGRFDDLWCLLDTEVKDNIISYIKVQLAEDAKNISKNKSCSLLAKWLPSCNTSSDETKRYARLIYKNIGMTEKQYRKTLSKIRSYLDVVEVKMSAKKWEEIDYAAVPSKANLVYNSAFLRNDEERRRAYLNALQKGETKINASVAFPHDIVHKYVNNSDWYSISLKPKDTTFEEMWKVLPNYVNGDSKTITIADGSGSMTSKIGGTNVMAIEAANALAIYFSERCEGQFKNKYITFSQNPQLVDFSKATSLRQKLEIAFKHNEVANTNIQAVFELLLRTAINQNMTQDDMPSNILILSDMEFDSMCDCGYHKRVNKTLFENFAEKYAEHGFKLPRLVFWNLMSRTGTIPVKENDLGVALVSGFSPAIMKMVLSNSTDPYECLLEQLNAERYNAVEEALKDVI